MLTRLLRRLFSQRGSTQPLAEARRLFDQGALEEAERACIACEKSSSARADVRYLRALIALAQRRNEDAVRHLEAAIAERDSDPTFHSKLGEVLRDSGDHRRAAVHFASALERLAPADPGRARAMLRLAAALQDCNRMAEAEQVYRRILDIDPAHPEALLCLAVMREDSDVEEARGIMDRYIERQDGVGARLRRALMLSPILQSSEDIDRARRRLDRDLDDLAGRDGAIQAPEFEVGTTAFNLAYHGRDDGALMRKLGQVVRRFYAAGTTLAARPDRAGSRVRIGFVSAHFYAHSIARNMQGLIKDLPRDAFEVQVFAIAPRNDEWSERVRQSADRYVPLPPDLTRARAAIESSALDVLFFTDIGIEPLTYFLAHWRLAPVQMVTWGHPVTSGIDTIDYFVSAESLEPPGSEAQYTETLIRLPGYYQPRYLRPRIDGPRKTRGELGLPEGKHLYSCLQNIFKLHPEFDAAIRAILDRDPLAEVLLLEFVSAGPMTQLRRRFERTLGAFASRVRFVPRTAHRDFLHYVAAADVILDPFHFGGGNSSLEALSLGIPVVTLPAFQLRGRFTLGLYRELGLDDCVARSPEDYVALALKLGQETEYRRSVSAQIADRSGRLFDRPDTASALGLELLRIVAARN
jgi:predicted O-linked N-acetylglucosamine transferase (SPINDLY family)